MIISTHTPHNLVIISIPIAADADKKYFMSEDKIFGQKNPHIFYKLDAEGKRTQFNRDFAYMTERRLREQAKNQDRQRSPKEGAAALSSPPVAVQSTKWNGIIGDLIIGSADMSFAALSVSKWVKERLIVGFETLSDCLDFFSLQVTCGGDWLQCALLSQWRLIVGCATN